jgi:hypothetical protein
MLSEYSLVQEYNGFGVYRCLHPWADAFLILPGGSPFLAFLILPGGSQSPGVSCPSLEEAKRLIDEFISHPESKLARALEALRQREHWRRERGARTRDSVRVFLRQLLRPTQAVPEPAENAIKSWIAQISRQLRGLNLEDSDDSVLAVEAARRGESPEPARELAEARLALFHLLCELDFDDDDRLEQILTAALTDREAALALAKQLDLEP